MSARSPARSGAVRSLAELGEFGFLDRLLSRLPSGRGVIVGPGDDCALVRTGRRVLATTDALVEDVHFRRAWMSPLELGRKAYLVNASDIAAMGGEPRFCLVSAAVPPDYPARDLAALHRGVASAARSSGAVVVGGNLAGASQLMVSVTLLGEAPPRPVRRRGARAGDAIYVTGSLGEAALGLRMLQKNPAARGKGPTRFRRPQPRLQAGAMLARAGVVSAMIDLSDGLMQDLAHVCDASGVGAEIELTEVPCSAAVRNEDVSLALCGGEDYELLCTAPERKRVRLQRLQRSLGVRLTRIGRILPRRDGVRVLDAAGRPVSVPGAGFDHFREARRR